MSSRTTRSSSSTGSSPAASPRSSPPRPNGCVSPSWCTCRSATRPGSRPPWPPSWTRRNGRRCGPCPPSSPPATGPSSRLVAHHGLAPERVHVAAPGADIAPLASGTDGVSRLLCVAAVTPRKGQHRLIEALATVTDLPWSCVCVGGLTQDPTYVAQLRGLIEKYGLGDRLHLAGPQAGAELDASYAAADLMVLTSYAETYGMAVTEALARGIPVLATDVGGLPEAVGRAPDGGVPGILVPPENPAALAAELRGWFGEADVRRFYQGRRAQSPGRTGRLGDHRPQPGRCAGTSSAAASEGGMSMTATPSGVPEQGVSEVGVQGGVSGVPGQRVSAPDDDVPRYAPQWLQLRSERTPPHGRPNCSTRCASGWRTGRAAPHDLVVHDLGCGTGSMGRWLAPRLDGAQHWILHDRDPYLLHFATVGAPHAAADGSRVTVTTQRGDIGRIDRGRAGRGVTGDGVRPARRADP